MMLAPINIIRSILPRMSKFFKPQSLSLKQVNYRGKTFVVNAKEEVGKRLIIKKEFESHEISCLEKLIRENDVCLDIGGNIGIYSVFMASKAHQGRVISFEPVPINRGILALNIHLNGINNVEVKDYAINDYSGTTQFTVCEDAAYSSIISTNRKKEARLLEVPSRTLDDLFAVEGKKIDIIKIDVEGAELHVLKGGEQLLSNPQLRPRALLIELNHKNQAVYGYGPPDVISFMKAVGYDVYSIVGGEVTAGWPIDGCTEDALFLPCADSKNEYR